MVTAGGILVYKELDGEIVVLLAHPGGPYYANKDVWSIPKGEVEAGEDELMAAQREFQEELGFEPPKNDFQSLGEVMQKSRQKVNHIWAVEGDVDLEAFDGHNSLVLMEWPPRSAKQIEFPENDRIAWHSLADAKAKLYKDQQTFIDRLEELLGLESVEPSPVPEPNEPQQSLF